MVKTFANAASLRGILQNPACPEILRDVLPIINKAWKMRELLTDTPENNANTSTKIASPTPTATIPGLSCALETFLGTNTAPQMIYTVREVKIGKYGFSKSRINLSQSRVLFQPVGETSFVPGEVQHVFKLGEAKTTYYLALRRYMKSPELPSTAFDEFPDFGASIVSEKLGEIEVTVANQAIHPTTSRVFGKGFIIIKDSCRVSP